MGLRLETKIGDKNSSYEVVDIINVNGRYKYKIKCICGNERFIESCLFKKLNKCVFCEPKSFEGKRNDKLIFLKYIGKSLYNAKCDCGKVCIVRKRSKSCGCHILEEYKKKAENLIGKKINMLKINGIDRHENKALWLKAKCKCGNKATIRNGCFEAKKSCGCLQKKQILRGSSVHNSKYKESEISTMKELYLTGLYSKKEICNIFSMNIASLTRILKGKAWKHVETDKKVLKNANKEILFELSHVKSFAKHNYESLIGKRFGSRTLIQLIKEPGKSIKALVKCDCGKESKINVYPILNGRSKKCLSCSIKKDKNDLIGKKFGSQTILNIFPHSRNRLKGLVRCDCGNERVIHLHHIIYQEFHDCPKCYKK
jgi:hypothetical protein